METTLATELVATQPPWLADRPGDGVVLSTRVRLARNLVDCPFPARASADQRAALLHRAQGALRAVDGLRDARSCEFGALSEVDRAVLLERRLVTREFATRGQGGGLVLDRTQTLSVMINEEDHLRVQIIAPGLDFRAAWQRVDAVDTALSRALPFAYDGELGFLTACPTNVGTGLRVSAMMHIPGTVLMDQIRGVVRAAPQLGLAVRGLFGEGTEAVGHVFQISNQSTLGEDEATILSRLRSVVRHLSWVEQNARRRLLAERPAVLADLGGRAYGALCHARRMGSEEALSHLFGLLLGVQLQMFTRLPASVVRELILDVQPGHLQLLARRELDGEERDVARADLIRERLARYR